MKTLLQAKGQVTVPKEARDELGLEPGDEVMWVRNDHGRWEICTFDQLLGDLRLGSGDLAEWTRQSKKGYRPKGPST